MKTKNISYLIMLLLIFTTTGCNDLLEEETFSVLGPSNFYSTAEDAESLLNGTYAAQGYRDILRDNLTFGEMTTDILIERQGGINALTKPVEDFTWDSSHLWMRLLWERYYRIIFRANVVIDEVPNIDMDTNRKEQIVAEARALRAYIYYKLYDLWGPTPLITTSKTSTTDRPSRPSKEVFITFLNDEFITAASVLPQIAVQHGRITKGAALGLLARVQINDKNWEKTLILTKQVMDLQQYVLFTNGNRSDLFNLENKKDKEFIFVMPFPDTPNASLGNTYLSHAAPPGYTFQFPPKVNFAAQFKIRTAFLSSFDNDDERLGAFLFEYTNGAGNLVQLGQDDVRSFKYPEDPNGIGDVSGNDFPVLRYADILLMRAEAVNELQGPTQEAIDLVNEIRNAAKITPISLLNYATKESLRDLILQERGREFHTEGLRRLDLIRHGKFIQMALDRGKPAKPFQVLFPIPQGEIDKNSNLVQNEGY